MSVSRIWLINPDAEQELNQYRLSPGAPYQPAAAQKNLGPRLSESFFDLTQAEPTIFPTSGACATEQLPPGSSAAVLWCPTESVRQFLVNRGASISFYPSMDLLTAVNDKLYVSDFTHNTIPGRVVVHSRQELHDTLSDRRWLSNDPQKRSVGAGGTASTRLKRRFGQAGRAQRRINEYLCADDERYIKGGFKHGGLIVEQECAVVENLSIHGVISESLLMIGEVCQSHIDRFSAPQQISLLDPEGSLRQLLKPQAQIIAQAVALNLKSRGYLGPFGLDFIHTADDQFYLIDINVRFTLGWSLGMSAQREAALAALPRYLLPSGS